MLNAVRQDVRFGWRTLVRTRSTAAIAVLTLGLGMGMSTAVFSVADALMMRALPYPAADRLVSLTDDNARGQSFNVALPNYDDWRASVDAIEAAAAWTPGDVNAIGPAGAERVRGVAFTGEFFQLTGATPVVGRTIGGGDEASSGPVAVLSTRAWRALLGSRGDLSGATVVLNGVSHDVVGVVATIPGFVDVDVWRPLQRTGTALSRRGHGFRAMARLRSGVSLEQARAQFDVVAAQLATAYPETNTGWHVGVRPFEAAETEELGLVLTLVGWIAGALLLVACTNVAGLLVARSADRQRELAVRAALGATRRRVVGQLLAEHTLLSAAGAAFGLLIAVWATGLIVNLLPQDIVPVREPGLSLRVVGFAAAMALVTGVFLGLVTAMTAWRPGTPIGLRDAAVATSAGGRRLRQGLVFVQITLACTILVGTALLLASLARALATDPGLEGGRVVTFQIAPPATTHPDAAALRLYYDALLARLSALPEVVLAGATSNLPMSDNETISTVRRTDEPAPERGQERFALHLISTPGYLQAIGARLVEGRDFAGADTDGAEPVVIVNQTLARELWPGRTAVGQMLMLEPDAPHRVVGVIADTRHFGLDQQLYGQYFVPLRQRPARALGFALRLRSDLSADRLREVVTAVDSTVPPYAVRTLESLVSGSLSVRRSLTMAVTACGVTIVLLAVVGLYGVVASGVRDRRREIGIRMALGATGARVVRLFVVRAAMIAAAGVACGLVASLWATGLVEQFLFGVEAVDLTAMAGTAALVGGASLVASWMSARHAARVNPIETLRTD